MFHVLRLFIFLFFVFGLNVTANAYPAYEHTQYDFWFRKYSLMFFSRAIDWQWFKAQAIAESSLNPNAVSSAGAVGLMQIMPSTGKELSKELGTKLLLTNPRINIMMGIYYDRKLWDNWTAKRPWIERLKLVFASYNAGLGNILKAQKLAKKDKKCNHLLWDCIKHYLKFITGRHSDETIDYVERIEYNYVQLKQKQIRKNLETLASIATVAGFFLKKR